MWDYGAERHGFPSFKRNCPRVFPADYVFQGRPNIRDILTEGQVIVQVNKEERGNKGAALTTFVSLAGSYLRLCQTIHVQVVSLAVLKAMDVSN